MRILQCDFTYEIRVVILFEILLKFYDGAEVPNVTFISG